MSFHLPPPVFHLAKAVDAGSDSQLRLHSPTRSSSLESIWEGKLWGTCADMGGQGLWV